MLNQILYEDMTNPPLPNVISADLKYYRGLGICGGWRVDDPRQATSCHRW